MLTYRVFVFCYVVISAYGQCTFQSPFSSSTWHDNTKGTLTFTSTGMTGWSLSSKLQQGVTISSWECLDNSDSLRLVFKATTVITAFDTTDLYTYMCLQLTKITDNSYYYYQMHIREPNAFDERVSVGTSNTLTAADVCSSSVVIPEQEYHVLLKSGSESLAAVQCPDSLLFTAPYTYEISSTTSCDTTNAVWDVCADNTEVFVNKTSCTDNVLYSDGGRLWCIASVTVSTYTCTVVYNQDATLSSSSKQFSCICSDGTTASIAPDNCTDVQIPSALPLADDGVTVDGHLATIGTKIQTCVPTNATTTVAASSEGLSAGIIAAIVIVVILIVAAAIALGIYCYFKKRKNRISENAERAEKPLIANGASVAHVETIEETSKAKKSASTMSREISAIKREPTDPDKMDINKSLITRNATMTSIGLREKSNLSLKRENSLKREKSNVSRILVKAKDDGDRKEPRLQMFGKNLSFLICCPERKEKDKRKVVVTEPEKPVSRPATDKKVKGSAKGGQTGSKATKSGKKATKGKAGGKGGNKAKETKQGDKMAVVDVKDDELQTEDTVAVQSVPGPQMTSTPIPKAGGKSPKLATKTPTHDREREKSTVSVKSAKSKATTVVSMSGITSSIMKPEQKNTEWTFLMCCFGNRAPPPTKPEEPDVKHPPVKAPAKKGKGSAAAKAGKAAPKKAAPKGGKGKAKKNSAAQKKTEQNGVSATDAKVEDISDKDAEVPGALERAKSMPVKVREKTALSIQDAEKVKVDVYIPDEKSPLQLKDTVTVVKGKNGEPKLEKAQTTIGVVTETKDEAAPPASNTKETRKDKPAGKKKKAAGKDKKNTKKKKK